jgi:hypothetical protein
MKITRGGRGVESRWRWVVNFTLRLLYPPWKYPCNWMGVGRASEPVLTFWRINSAWIAQPVSEWLYWLHYTGSFVCADVINLTFSSLYLVSNPSSSFCPFRVILCYSKRMRCCVGKYTRHRWLSTVYTSNWDVELKSKLTYIFLMAFRPVNLILLQPELVLAALGRTCKLLHIRCVGTDLLATVSSVVYCSRG